MSETHCSCTELQPHPTRRVKAFGLSGADHATERPDQVANTDPACLAYGSHGDRERERGSRERGRGVQGRGGVVDDVRPEGEEGAVEEVEDRHPAAAVVSSPALCSGEADAPETRPYVRCDLRARRLGEGVSG